ncbi:hypothetical protein LEP1GSC039_0681 [Leptospira santarosai str. 2000027870]|uniref:hypothetical protein n=1 Tax=Leptospira santarosai TaxID=28183 RepID=UPI0002BF00F1|nr:hypothetical protein [Leptospira santarosai]EMM85114.1 hypothetical protein LEP1GSC039_0681 [Leptospira santarosai str. 2000027870]
MAEDYEMIKDDNSDGESRDLGMDELQFDDIDSMLVPESSSEPSGLEDLSIDPLESLVASSGEEYPSSFENDFYFHPEEVSSASSDPSLEDLESPLVDVEIDKLLDVGDFPDSSKISNLESDDSFFNSGDSAPDEGMDFSELDSYLTEESDDMEEFDLSDQEGNPLREDDFLNEDDPIALSELKEIVSTDESQGDDSIAFSGSELDDILNTEPSAVTNFAEDENDLPDFITHSDFDEDEGTIALSDDELGNLLASETEEPVSSFGTEDTSFEVEDEEPIALSDDELEDLLVSESEEPISSFGTEESSFEVEDEEPIALSDDELGNLLASENEEPISSFGTEESSFEVEDEEPIALSEDELGNLLASESEEPISSFGTEESSFEVEDEGTIALSEDELGNLLASESEEPISSFGTEDTSFEVEDEEAIALSEDELGNLLASESEEPISSFGSEDTSFEVEDEEAIALSEDELGNLLASETEEPVSSFGSEESSFEVEDEEAIALSEDELGNLLASESEEPISSFGSEDTSFEVEDEEAIALSDDELGNLLSDDSNMGTDGFEDTGSMFKENESPSLPAEQDLGGPDEFGLEEAPSDSSVDFELNEFFPEPEGEDKESIALSEEELGNLLSSEDTFASAKEEDLNEILGELPLVSDLDAFDSIDDDVSKEEVTRVAPTTVNEDEMIIVLDEYADEEKSSPIEELRKTPDQSETPIQGDASGETPSKEEMKRIMTYLDELLGNLPDDLIREFSRSDYFELYKKLMKQIGV